MRNYSESFPVTCVTHEFVTKYSFCCPVSVYRAFWYVVDDSSGEKLCLHVQGKISRRYIHPTSVLTPAATI